MTSPAPDAVLQFRDAVKRVVPPETTVVVVSRGDGELLKLEAREGWHFPQRADGVYLGYYPPDSETAIAHLEELRERGAGYLGFPATAAWWLEHYPEFASHLERAHRLLVHDDAGVIYALGDAPALDPPATSNGDTKPEPAAPPPAELREDARALFDLDHYGEQAGVAFPSADAALEHYLAEGHRRDLDPHRLFDGAWYRERHMAGEPGSETPLLHFLRTAIDERPDPNPYFDSDYVYGQLPELAEQRVNALVHYVREGARGTAVRPNPLFHDAYYRQTYPDVQTSGLTPLEHYLRHGAPERRFVSHIHRNVFDRLREASVRRLLRGNWAQGSALAFVRGGAEEPAIDVAELSGRLAADHRLDCVVVALRRSPALEASGAKLLVLEDYQLACAIFRPSALRMLSRALAALGPVLAVTEVDEAAWPLREAGVATFPAEAAARPVADLLADVVRDGRADPEIALPQPARRPGRPSRIVVIASDWTVSGVNAALEAVGQELLRHGWEVEILFTRDPEFVVASAQGAAHMPGIPHRYLERSRPGLDGMWEALISDLQRNGPCIAFLAYDQVANAVIGALTDEIGVVSWVQADDGDYYEQAYRLGRYCNAIVCVSSHIRETAAALNPAVAGRTHVIHNSSVSAREVARRRPPRADRMRLVYTGRLVQYQKRILDFVELARALDATGEPYEISLIGAFSGKDATQGVFEERAREHLADGRIRLLVRLPRARILDELAANAFFVLLSDFEGLPLSLVEAMARGCVPVVARSPSGIPEIVDSGRNGHILSGRDYGEWARLLVALWRDPDRLESLSAAARGTVRDAFTIEKIGLQFDEVLNAIADEIESGRYARPPALTWGADRSPSGDVLPPPSLFLAAPYTTYPGLS